MWRQTSHTSIHYTEILVNIANHCANGEPTDAMVAPPTGCAARAPPPRWRGTCSAAAGWSSAPSGGSRTSPSRCLQNTTRTPGKLELTRDRLHSFVRSFVQFLFVRSFRYGNVLLPQFTRHSLVIFRPRTFHPCTT